jgi:phage recombination protein Bet
MVTLDIPEEGEKGLPCELKIASMIKKGDKVVAGQTYRWQIQISSKGQRSILNVGPAKDEETFKTGKEILQQNIDAKRAEEAAANIAKQNAEIEKKNAEDKAAAEALAAEHREKNEQKKAEKDQQPKPQGIIEKLIESDKKHANSPEGTDVHALEIVKAITNLKDLALVEEYWSELLTGDPYYKDFQAAIDYVKTKLSKKQGGIEKICADTKKRVAEARKEVVMVVPTEVVEKVPQNQSVAVREVSPRFDPAQIALIRAKCAPNCTPTEFELLMYMADKYQLDPLVRQIWAVKYKDAPAAIFCGRDGFLEIAHRSGQFNGMESGTREEGEEIIGWAKVYRKDMSHAFYVEVYLKEYQKPIPYSGKPGLWQTMPRVMIQKVAESSCLRRAFSISGLYSPEEMPEEQGGK